MNKASIKGSMGDVADFAMTPVRRSIIRDLPLDAVSAGNTLANMVIAKQMVEEFSWQEYAVAIIQSTVEARVQFIKVIADWKKDLVARNSAAMGTLDKAGKPNPTKDETKLSAQRVASATNRVSVMNTIAKACNNGFDVGGLFAHIQGTNNLSTDERDALKLEDVGLAVIYEYAKKFSDSKAGPKPKPFLEKLNKWLDENKGREDNAQDKAQRDAVMAFVANLK